MFIIGTSFIRKLCSSFHHLGMIFKRYVHFKRSWPPCQFTTGPVLCLCCHLLAHRGWRETFRKFNHFWVQSWITAWTHGGKCPPRPWKPQVRSELTGLPVMKSWNTCQLKNLHLNEVQCQKLILSRFNQTYLHNLSVHIHLNLTNPFYNTVLFKVFFNMQPGYSLLYV